MATKKIVEENENAVVEKEAVNVLDLLLGADIGTIKTPYKDVEITRLSEAFGAPFVVRCEALSPEKYEEVQDNAISISGKDVDLDMNNLQMLTVIEGVKAIITDAITSAASPFRLLRVFWDRWRLWPSASLISAMRLCALAVRTHWPAWSRMEANFRSNVLCVRCCAVNISCLQFILALYYYCSNLRSFIVTAKDGCTCCVVCFFCDPV